jgi:hypothetical protein
MGQNNDGIVITVAKEQQFKPVVFAFRPGGDD